MAIKNAKRVKYLKDPFRAWNGPPLPEGLLDYLRPKLGQKTAQNHALHADRARKHLRRLVETDLEEHYDSDRERFSLRARGRAVLLMLERVGRR